jgi:hypothetical protein
MKIDWDDPDARFALIQRVGVTEYNRLMQERHARNTVATVNGHAIKQVQNASVVCSQWRAVIALSRRGASLRAGGSASSIARCLCGFFRNRSRTCTRATCTEFDSNLNSRAVRHWGGR